MPLYRVQSKKRLSLPNSTGVLRNPNIERPRRSRDLSHAAHEVADQWFLASFGVRYRTAALFCSGSKEAIAGYIDYQSLLIEVSPLGDFSLCYSENIKDLYGHLQFQNRMNPENLHLLPTELSSLGYLNCVNSGIEEAANTGCEVMVYAEYFQYKICT